MYKVMITQMIGQETVGQAVLVDDFADLDDAINAAEEHSAVYDDQIYQIRKYDERKTNIISFDNIDSGEIVYEKGAANSK